MDLSITENKNKNYNINKELIKNRQIMKRNLIIN